MTTASALKAINNTSNAAETDILQEIPFTALMTVEGTAPLLFHAWNVEAVESKSKARKGSAQKKQDNVESYVYRNTDGEICIPGEYFRMCAVYAAKYSQDPRSPRKSAMDLFKAGVVVLNELCSLGTKDWDYLDRRRVQVQRSGITRERPAMAVGWSVELQLQILTPEYISPAFLHEVLERGGRLIGVGDFRPTFGRFRVTQFSTEPLQ